MLNADLVLTGSLRAMPTQLRLRMEMIRIRDGVQTWVEDVMAVQGEVAHLELEVFERLLYRLESDALSLSIAASEEAPGEPNAARLEAQSLYLRAHYEWQSFVRHSMQDAIENLQRALELDPSLVAARHDLMRACAVQGILGFTHPQIAAEIARRAAQPILDKPEAAGIALPVMGWISFYADHDLNSAERWFSRYAAQPGDSWGVRLRTIFLSSCRRFDESIALLRAAIEEDPFAPWLHASLAWTLHLAGRAEESVAEVRRSLDAFWSNEGYAYFGSNILAFNGDTARAVEIADAFSKGHPYLDLATAAHAYALACAGRDGDAHAILDRLRWLAGQRFVMQAMLAPAYVALGNHDSAIECLRLAERDRCPWFFQALADPRLKPLHGRREFEDLKAILKRMESHSAESRDIADESDFTG
jgi:tetratricopeptide (TPR) repeat protein